MHAVLDLLALGRTLDEGRLLLVLREDLDLTRQQALLGVRPELDLALALHREARLAGEARILVGLADDQLDGRALARGHARLVAIAAAHELGEPPRELRLEQAQAHAARRLGEDAVAFDPQLGHVAGRHLGADRRRRALDDGDDGLPHLLDEKVQVDLGAADLEAFLLVQQRVDAGRVPLGDAVHGVDLEGRLVSRFRARTGPCPAGSASPRRRRSCRR